MALQRWAQITPKVMADSGYSRLAAQEGTEQRGAAAPARRGRVLVVENNPSNQQVAIRLLQRESYRVDALASGYEALDLLERVAYDLIIMDCQMPRMDGYETTERIRQQEETQGRRTPIIAMTALVMEGDENRCLAAGMDDYIPKPVSLARWTPSRDA
jgi:CheY-like chemotaxis protein